jgi:hypothetical protein
MSLYLAESGRPFVGSGSARLCQSHIKFSYVSSFAASIETMSRARARLIATSCFYLATEMPGEMGHSFVHLNLELN